MPALRLALPVLALAAVGCVQPPAEGGQEGEPLGDSGTVPPASLSGTVSDGTEAGLADEGRVVVEIRDHAATVDGWPDPTRQPIQSIEVPWAGDETAWSTQLDTDQDTVDGVMIFALWDDGSGDLYEGPWGRYAEEPITVGPSEHLTVLHRGILDRE